MKLLAQHVESLIFTSEQAISPEEIISCLKTVYGWELKKEDITMAVNEIKERYHDDLYSFELNEIAGGYQFLSKKDYHGAIHVMLQLKEKKRLSTAALETLAIIAYKQPITKPELEHIRGVSCDYSIQKLLEKELIVIAGKSDGPGKPLMYATSRNFMDHFGLSSVKDLPKLKDIQSIDANEIGIPSDMNEDVNEEVQAAFDEKAIAQNDVAGEPIAEFEETIIEYDEDDQLESTEEDEAAAEPEKE